MKDRELRILFGCFLAGQVVGIIVQLWIMWH